MTVARADFLTEFTEFDALPVALVDAKLAEAHLLYSTAAWGTLYDYVVKYACADALAMTPAGQPMALLNDDGQTIYSARMRRVFYARNAYRCAVL